MSALKSPPNRKRNRTKVAYRSRVWRNKKREKSVKGDGDNLRLSEQFMTGAWWRLPLLSRAGCWLPTVALLLACLLSIALVFCPAAYNEPILKAKAIFRLRFMGNSYSKGQMSKNVLEKDNK